MNPLYREEYGALLKASRPAPFVTTMVSPTFHRNADEPCWASLPVSLFAEILRCFGGLEARYDVFKSPDHPGRGWLTHTGVDNDPAAAAHSTCPSNVSHIALVCRDWYRLFHEGIALLRPAVLPVPHSSSQLCPQRHQKIRLPDYSGAQPQISASIIDSLNFHLHRHQQQYPEHTQKRRSLHHGHPDRGQDLCSVQGQEHMQVPERRNAWMTFPHLTQLDLSGVQVAVQDVSELRRQQEALEGLGGLRALRGLKLPLALLVATVASAMRRLPFDEHVDTVVSEHLHSSRRLGNIAGAAAVEAGKTGGIGSGVAGSSATTDCAAASIIHSKSAALATPRQHGPYLSWPPWLMHLTNLSHISILTYCRTTVYDTGNTHPKQKRHPHHPYHNHEQQLHHDRYCSMDPLVSRFDGIRIEDLPPLFALASLELQLPGSAVAGPGLLQNLPSLRLLDLYSVDSRPLAGLRLAEVLSQCAGVARLAHLHLPCLSASLRRPIGEPTVIAAAAAGSAGAASALEGLRALAAAASFPLEAAAAMHHASASTSPPSPPAPHDFSQLPSSSSSAAAAAGALRTSLQSLSLSGRCLLADLLAAAAHLSGVTSLSLAGCDVRPRGLAEGLLTRHPGDGVAAGGGGGRHGGTWEMLYGTTAAVPPVAWCLRRLDLSGCRWLSSVPLFAANISRLLLALSPPGHLQVLDLSDTGITRLPEALLLPLNGSTSGGDGADRCAANTTAVTATAAATAIVTVANPAAASTVVAGLAGGLGAVLTYLNLSGNVLTAIPEALGDGCPRLRTLRADCNGSGLGVQSPTTCGSASACRSVPLYPLLMMTGAGGPAAAAGTAAAAAAAGFPGGGGGGGGAGRALRMVVIPSTIEELSLITNSSLAALSPSPAMLSEHPATRLRRLRVSFCSLPALVAMLPYLPVLSDLVAMHVPASVRGAVGIAAVAKGSGEPMGLIHRPGPASGAMASNPASPTNVTAPATLAKSLRHLTIRGDVAGNRSTARHLADGSNSGGSVRSCSSSNNSEIDSDDAGGAIGWWLERLCACAPGLRTLSYTRMGLTAVPDGIAAAAMLVYLDLSSNWIARVSSFIGELSRLECLDLSRNRLTCLPYHVFIRLTQLTSLEVHSNAALSATAVALLKKSLPGVVRFRSDYPGHRECNSDETEPATVSDDVAAGDVEWERLGTVVELHDDHGKAVQRQRVAVMSVESSSGSQDHKDVIDREVDADGDFAAMVSESRTSGRAAEYRSYQRTL